MLRERPQLAKDGYEVGDQVPGRILHARYSQYMAQVAELEPELVAQLAEHRRALYPPQLYCADRHD